MKEAIKRNSDEKSYKKGIKWSEPGRKKECGKQNGEGNKAGMKQGSN